MILKWTEGYLEGLIAGKYKPKNSYSSNINSATRNIHLQVWMQCPSNEKVRKDYIPLLEKARDSLDAKPDKFTSHVKSEINHRIRNLERYCEGLPSHYAA
jgi:hypothetical protein